MSGHGIRHLYDDTVRSKTTLQGFNAIHAHTHAHAHIHVHGHMETLLEVTVAQLDSRGSRASVPTPPRGIILAVQTSCTPCVRDPSPQLHTAKFVATAYDAMAKLHSLHFGIFRRTVSRIDVAFYYIRNNFSLSSKFIYWCMMPCASLPNPLPYLHR